MTDFSAQERRQHLVEGLNYLRRHALDAHRSGDGLLVLALSSTALRRSQEFGKGYPTQKLHLSEVRWAFSLGMYWFVYDWFLLLVRSAFEHLDCSGDGDTDRELLVRIHNRLRSPHGEPKEVDFAEIPESWWAARFGAGTNECEEDAVALSFLIELIWYSSPAADEWRRIIERWQADCPNESPMHARLLELRSRLQYQTGMYSGGAFEPAARDSIPINDPLQREVFHGWISYYNCEWVELGQIIDRLKDRLTIEHPTYLSFFYLIHASRMYRPDAEDQFTSLPRLYLARSRQAAQTFLHTREAHARDQFLAVAWADFPANSMGSERVACLRMAMLVQIQSLRAWDVGSWLKGLRQRADSRIELGASGQLDNVLEAVLDAVLSHHTPDDYKSPRFARCLTRLDSLDDDSRRTVTRRLLKSLPIEWRDAHKVLSTLSDAIPEDVLSEVADWSLRVEATNLIENHWTPTLLDVWNDILLFASRSAELSGQLAPALRRAVIDPRCWEKLHDAILAAMVHAPASLADELVGLMFDVECRHRHFVEWRFSIGFNVLKRRPQVGSQLLSHLRADVEVANDPYQRQLLDAHESPCAADIEGRAGDFRQMIRQGILARIGERHNLTGPSYEIGGSNFHSLAKLVSWPAADDELVNSLVAAIESETVLYDDKIDYLHFLADLVKSGQISQAESIAKVAAGWLTRGIPGRSVGPDIGGPLSIGHGFFVRSASLQGPLFRLVKESAIRCTASVFPILFEWMPLNASLHVPRHAYYLLGICYAMSTVASANSEQSAAIMIGLAEAIALLSIETMATDVVLSFDSTILQSRATEIVTAVSEQRLWCQMLLKQWEQRLGSLARNPRVNVRQCVANAVRHWIDSGLPNDELAKVKEQLANDCRLRVRHAISQSDDAAASGLMAL